MIRNSASAVSLKGGNSSSPDPKSDAEPVLRISVPFRNNPMLRKTKSIMNECHT